MAMYSPMPGIIDSESEAEKIVVFISVAGTLVRRPFTARIAVYRQPRARRTALHRLGTLEE
jgi:hypothetical protein